MSQNTKRTGYDEVRGRSRTGNGLARGALALLMAVSAAPAVGGCAADPAPPVQRGELGTLRLPLSAELDGARYWLEATFAVSGPESALLTSTASEPTLSKSLPPGAYTIELEAGFRVLMESGSRLVPVVSELASEARQAFEITSGATTPISYRFVVDGRTIELEPGQLVVEFELERGPTDGYLTTWAGVAWYRVPVRGPMTDANIRAACASRGLQVPCQTNSVCGFNDQLCSPVTAETSCGNPMQDLARHLCGDTPPSSCPPLYDTFQYMGEAWSGGCGAVEGQWCVAGNSATNGDALCTATDHAPSCAVPLTLRELPPLEVGRQPYWIGAADLDLDGALDVLTANQGSSDVSVLFGNGDGSFEPARSHAALADTYALEGELSDFTADGLVDLAFIQEPGVTLLVNGGNRTFAPPLHLELGDHPISIVAADFSGDGLSDLAVADNVDTVAVAINAGNGNFGSEERYSSGSSARALAAGDMNGDGAADLAVANGSDTSVTLLMNTGSGFASPVSYEVGFSPISLAIVDLDDDGDRDLAVASFGDANVTVLRNQGNGALVAGLPYPVGWSPYWLEAADLTGDSKPDLAVANVGSGDLSILVNRGTGEFLPAVTYGSDMSPTSLALADLDGSGSLDLAVADYNFGDGSVPMSGRVRVLLNECGGP